jgi:hypothetical protein
LALGLGLWCDRAFAQAPIQAGVAMGLRFYDHEQPLAQPATYSARTITPLIRIHAQNGSSLLLLDAERRFEFYTNDVGLDSLIGTGDHTADRATLEARHEFSELDEIQASARYVRSRDLLDLDEGTVSTGGDQTRWDFDTRGELWHAEGSFYLDDHRYQEIGTSDAQDLEWTARAVPLRLPEQAIYLGFTQQRIDLDQKNGFGPWTVLDRRIPHAGYRRAITPTLKAELTGGVADVTFGDGGRQTRPALGAALTRREDAPTTFHVEVGFEGDSLAVVRASVGRRLGNGALWLRGESEPDAEGGFQHYPVVQRRIAAGVRDTLSRANVLNFETSYENDRPLHFVGPRSEVFRVSGWLMRRMQPWLDATVGLSFLRDPVIQHPGESLYRRLRMDAELTATLP